MDRLTALCARVLARLLESDVGFGSKSCQCGKGRVVITWEQPNPEEVELSGTHRRLLDVLRREPLSVRSILREAGYAKSSESTVRQGLADLVKMRRATHSSAGYCLRMIE
jgi:hypothetical protein